MYKVVDSTGATDELNIGFEFFDPDSIRLEKLDPASGGSYFGEARKSGDFGLCLVINPLSGFELEINYQWTKQSLGLGFHTFYGKILFVCGRRPKYLPNLVIT